jgi:predicted nucleic acid-binding protein
MCNVAGDYPSLYNFLNHIIKEEKNTVVVSTQILVRTTTNPKRKKYEKFVHQIKEIVQEFTVVSHENCSKMARSVFNFLIVFSFI